MLNANPHKTAAEFYSSLVGRLEQFNIVKEDWFDKKGCPSKQIQNLIIEELRSGDYAADIELERQALVFLANLFKLSAKPINQEIQAIINDPNRYRNTPKVRDDVSVKPRDGEHAIADIYDALSIRPQLRVLFLESRAGRVPLPRTNRPKAASIPPERIRPVGRVQEKPSDLHPDREPAAFASRISDGLLQRLGVIDEESNPCEPVGDTHIDQLRHKLWNVCKGGMAAGEQSVMSWALELAGKMGIDINNQLPPPRAMRG